MNVVELLSDNSPLVIVHNEKQDRRRDLDESRLRGRFVNLRAVTRTNLATNRGLDDPPASVPAHRTARSGNVQDERWRRVEATLATPGVISNALLFRGRLGPR